MSVEDGATVIIGDLVLATDVMNLAQAKHSPTSSRQGDAFASTEQISIP